MSLAVANYSTVSTLKFAQIRQHITDNALCCTTFRGPGEAGALTETWKATSNEPKYIIGQVIFLIARIIGGEFKYLGG